MKEESENVALMPKVSWRHKFKATWLKEGDHKTTYFFTALPTLIGKKNFIYSLCINGMLPLTKRRSMIQSLLLQESL